MGKIVKNICLSGAFMIGMFVFSACGNGKDLSNYVDVKFSGINTKGTATFSLDSEKMLKDTLNYDVNKGMPTEKQQEEISNMDNAYTIKLDKEDNLKNGDKVKVTVTVDKEKTKKIKSGEKTVEVKGLEEPKKLTNSDVEKHLVVNFNGVSGRGQAKIDNTFDSPLDTVKFTIENDGKLKNGDKAKVLLSKESENQLIQSGYLPDENFEPTFEVKGLDSVAEKATEIANIVDIKRMIDEGINRKYKSSETNKYEWDYRYEITEEKLMYRQFKKETKESQDSFYWGATGSDNGNLIKIFTVKKYSGGAEGKLKETQTVIYGYTDIMLNDKKEANVAELTEISETKDDTYSLDSVIKLYEGYGYSEVK
ncbi:hypothetical protein ACMUWL_002592 [Enterococcus faecalis]